MLKRYKVPSVRHEGWAVIVLDTDIGFFAAVSDFGDYAYAWSHPGCEFRKFVIGLEPDYLHSKLTMGRGDARVMDERGTLKAIRDRIQETTFKDPEEKAREKLLAHNADLDCREGFALWYNETRLDEAYELAVYVPQPQCMQFCTRIMPRFKEILRNQLAAEEAAPITPPKEAHP